ncbi:peptidyl-prolyl cis-trans isomerase FKBP3-like [Stigmatopora nigra]
MMAEGEEMDMVADLLLKPFKTDYFHGRHQGQSSKCLQNGRMNQELVPAWTAEQLRSDHLSKKNPIKLSQDTAAHSFLNEHRLLGNIKNGDITVKKEQLVDAITNCLSAKFKATGSMEEVTAVKIDEDQRSQGKVSAKFTKSTLKKSDRIS